VSHLACAAAAEGAGQRREGADPAASDPSPRWPSCSPRSTARRGAPASASAIPSAPAGRGCTRTRGSGRPTAGGGPERHRPALDQAGVGGRFGGAERAGDAGDRRLRCCALGHEGQARRASAGQAARRPS
jgi:hypothetical protein